MTHTYWYEDGRYTLSFPYEAEDIRERIKRYEGRRWDRAARQWSLPASPRAMALLDTLGFDVPDSYWEATRDAEDRWLRPIFQPTTQTKLGSYTLWPYQEAGVQWLPDKALLFDQQALGKTLEAIAWAADNPYVVVISKLVLQPQWAATLADTGVSQTPYIVPQGRGFRSITKGWTLVNWERVRKILPPKDGTPITLILDEATAIKNTRTQRTQKVMELSRSANRILCLTGTPVVNRPIELWAMLVLLGQRYKYEFFPWAKRYCGAYETPYGWDMTGATFLNDLRDDLLQFGLRRTKEEVKLQLPPKVREILTVSISEKNTQQLRVAEAEVLGHVGRGVGLTSGDGFGSLQRLRVESAVAKAPFAAEWLTTRDSKVIVFCAFKEPLRIIQRMYKERMDNTKGCVLATGDESTKVRADNIMKFKTNPHVKVLCMTYDVGGEGLDIPQADTVVLLDRPWTPAAVEQAEDRVHRPGNKADRVLIVSMTTGMPIETQVDNTLGYKGNIIEAIVGMADNTHVTLPTRGLL